MPAAKKAKPVVYSNIMLDGETCGTVADAVFLSIGAVKFNAEGELGGAFYRAIKIDSQPERRIQADTLAWWMKQSPEAQAVFHDKDAVSLNDALFEFAEFVDHPEYTMWSNGASFDIPMLEHAYRSSSNFGTYWFNDEKYGHQAPWAFWNSGCYRTMKNRQWAKLLPKAQNPMEHNALQDAIVQALHLQQIMLMEKLMIGGMSAKDAAKAVVEQA